MAETAAPPAHNGVAASQSPRAPSASIDPVAYEIIQGKVFSVVDEMAIVMTKTSMRPVIYEVLDFACGICNAKGELIARTNGITLFTGAFGAQIRSVIDRFGGSIFSSDVIVTNDLFRGGTHACDFAIVRPVFAESRLIAFAINVAHWLDVGGAIPGSLPPDATSIFQEGLRLPCVKLDSALKGQRSVFLTREQGWVACNVYDRNRLPIGSSIPGPALIEEPTTTTFVLSDQRFARDETGQLIMWSP